MRVVPNRLQFFQYETVLLSCGDEDSQWTIKRNTSQHSRQGTTAQNKSNWFFNGDIYPSDTGVYWCESEKGECGGVVNITVTGGDVILESPVLPVAEEGSVTLRCIMREFIPEVTCRFYRDDYLAGNNSSGNLTISSVSVSDAGLYTCQCGGDLSAESRLEVTHTDDTACHPPRRSEPHISVMYMALPVVACVSMVCMMLFFLWRKLKEREKRDFPYTDVTIIQTPQPRRFKVLSELSLKSTSSFVVVFP